MTLEEMNANCMSEGMNFNSNHKTLTLTLRFCFFNNNRNEDGTCSFDGLPAFFYNCSSNIAENLTKDLNPTNSYCSSLNIHSSDSTNMTATFTSILDTPCSATSLIIVFGIIGFILLVLCLILLIILLFYCYKHRHMKSSNVISFTPGKILYIMVNYIYVCYIIRSWNISV